MQTHWLEAAAGIDAMRFPIGRPRLPQIASAGILSGHARVIGEEHGLSRMSSLAQYPESFRAMESSSVKRPYDPGGADGLSHLVRAARSSEVT